MNFSIGTLAQAIAAEASMSETLSIEMEDEVRRALDRLVQQTARSVDDIVNQAVRDYLEVREWQQRKIEAGIAAADRGEFATEDEIARIAAKYPKRG
jgi:predicted transcriptional regulator